MHFQPGCSKGHTWNECSKLKATNLNNKEKKAVNTAKIRIEETRVPVSTLSSIRPTTKISSYPCRVIDTDASSRMSNNFDHFIHFETIKGTFRLGDDSIMETYGRGTVMILGLGLEKRLQGMKLLPRAIEGYLIGYTSSDKIYRIYLPLQHKVSETLHIHWTTRTIIPLGHNIMESLIAEET